MAPKLQLLLFLGILLTLTPVVVSKKIARHSPLIFIPGKGGSQIEAKIDRKPEEALNPDCKLKDSWNRVWLDVWQFLWPGQLLCWSENVRLYYNRTTKKSNFAPGIDFRVPGFGDTHTVEYIDDSWTAFMIGNIGAYFAHVTDDLEEWGYTRGKDVRAAPYDFRFAPHNHHDYFARLRTLVEETYEINDNTRVTIMSHSMGGIQGLYFLHTVPQEWKDKYIKAFVPINAPWKGTVIVSALYTSGYNWGIAPLSKEVVKSQQRSWETGVMMLPQPDVWDPKEVLVRTPRKNYTINDYDDYFTDVGFPDGKKMFDNIQHTSYDMGHPGVDTYCVYSYGLETPDQLVYDDSFPDGEATILMGEGDGTVNLKSLQYCHTWKVKPDQNHKAIIKTYEFVPHIDLLFDAEFLLDLKEILFE